MDKQGDKVQIQKENEVGNNKIKTSEVNYDKGRIKRISNRQPK